MSERTLNAVYSRPTMRRRYEVWFLKLMLADGSGAWWFRYLLMNPGRQGCGQDARGRPVQVWSTWFSRDGSPEHYLVGFPWSDLSISAGDDPLSLRIGDNRIDEGSCSGRIEENGHRVTWDLAYASTFSNSITDVPWIGFSRTPHSDAIFSGRIEIDGTVFTGHPLGYGLQGHNCGYRHRNAWSWTHCIALGPDAGMTTFEALEYEVFLGLWFRKAVLWHQGKRYVFKKLVRIARDRGGMRWEFKCASSRGGVELLAEIDGSGPLVSRLPYLKTDCSGSFETSNNSLARATLLLDKDGRQQERIDCNGGAVLEMVGG